MLTMAVVVMRFISSFALSVSHRINQIGVAVVIEPLLIHKWLTIWGLTG